MEGLKAVIRFWKPCVYGIGLCVGAVCVHVMSVAVWAVGIGAVGVQK